MTLFERACLLVCALCVGFGLRRWLSTSESVGSERSPTDDAGGK